MKRIAFSILMIFTIVLTACSALSTVSTANAELPIETQLAIGTLKLEGTEKDVTAEQAQELIILWKVYGELSQSDTAAQAEVDGLIAQIQENMTSEQMQAITAMQLNQQDVVVAIQGSTVFTSFSQSNSNGKNVTASGGGMPAGGPPADGGSAAPDGGMPADMGGAAPASSTDQTQNARASSGLEGTAGVPSALVEALIQSLEQKIAS